MSHATITGFEGKDRRQVERAVRCAGWTESPHGEVVLAAGRAVGDVAADHAVLVVVDDVQDPALVSSWFAQGARHVLPMQPPRLVSTLAWLGDGPSTGVARWLAPGAQVEQLRCVSSRQKAECLERIDRLATALSLPRRVASSAMTVVDELITNAFFHAPVTSGQPRYASRPRSEVVTLDGIERIVFELGSDAGSLAVSVRDPFGSLRVQPLLQRVSRGLAGGADQIRTAGPGAGMGITMTLSMVKELVVTVRQRRATEVVALIDVTGSYRQASSWPKSISVFEPPGR